MHSNPTALKSEQKKQETVTFDLASGAYKPLMKPITTNYCTSTDRAILETTQVSHQTRKFSTKQSPLTKKHLRKADITTGSQTTDTAAVKITLTPNPNPLLVAQVSTLFIVTKNHLPSPPLVSLWKSQEHSGRKGTLFECLASLLAPSAVALIRDTVNSNWSTK